jgi:type IX secretion system PorP/SprF family membrane protein
MQQIKNIKLLFIASLIGFQSMAQDPHFTQFYSAPLTVNPAYTGHFDGSFRAISNYRQQWISSINPINTTSIEIDGRLNAMDASENKPYSLGLLFMNDNTMKGVFTSNYLMASGSYQKELDYEGMQKLGIGFNATYGNRNIDFSNLTFSEQFRSEVGYNIGLPTGEAALSSMKSFISLGTGLLYNYQNRENGIYFDAGISAYHLNRPKQSVLKDDNQVIPVRYSAQMSWQHYISDDVMFNVKALYQNQASMDYILGGVSVAKMLGENLYDFVGAGAWIRSKDAISPYIFLEFGKTQLGLTYDIITSDLKNGPKPTKSFEMSLQWRLDKEIR